MNAITVVSNAQYKVGTAAQAAISAGEKAPIADPDDRGGWLFTKPVANAEKFNYFFYGEGKSAITLGHIKHIYANIAVDNYQDINSLPFIIVYTKPTGSGDAGAWYHSKIMYHLPTFYNVQLGEIITMHTHTTAVDVDYGFRKVWASNVVTDGDAAASEEILYITLHTDSASPAGTQILVSDFGYKTNHQLSPIDRKIKLIS